MYVLERTKYDEKRDFLRMELEIPVTLKIRDSEETVAGVCRDLSGTGMLVEIRRPTQLGEQFEVTVPSSRPDLELGDLDATVEVMRVIERDADLLEVGLKIVGIRP